METKKEKMCMYTVAYHMWRRVQPLIVNGSLPLEQYQAQVEALKNELLAARERGDVAFITNY